MGQADKDVTSLGQVCVAEKKLPPMTARPWGKLSQAVNMRWLSKTHMLHHWESKEPGQPPTPPGKYDVIHGFLKDTDG